MFATTFPRHSLPTSRAIDAFIRGFNAIDTRLLIFVLLCGNYVTARLTSNEESYLPMALQFVDPGWIPNSFSLTEFAGTRGLFQFAVGHLLEVVPFEWVASLGRTAMYAIYSFPLAAIFEYFELPNVAVLFVLQFVLRKYQTFFGGEWLFQGFETKAVAYAFVFGAYLAFLRQRYFLAVCWLVAASYFHILVGGWIAVALFLFMLAERVPLRRILASALLYVALVGPFAAYLLAGESSGPGFVAGISTDWIYTYFRNPHHTVVFHNGWKFFVEQRLGGILWIVGCLAASIIILVRRYRPQYEHVLRLNIVMYLMVLSFVVVAWFDREGVLLKYYLFRINAFAWLSTVLLGVACLRGVTFPPQLLRAVQLVVILGCTGYFVSIVVRNAGETRVEDRPYEQMIAYVVADTPRDAVFVFDPNDKLFLDFSRRTRRENFVTWKVEPAGGAKVLAWYARLQQADVIDRDPNLLDGLARPLHIDYFLTRKDYPGLHRAPVCSYGPYRLYKFG